MTTLNLDYPYLNDKTFPFLLTDNNNNPVNITSYTAYFTIKTTPLPNDPGILQKSLGSGIVFTNAAQGQLSVTIAKTDPLVVGTPYWYDLTLFDPSLNKTTVCSGVFNVQQTYTFRLS